MRSALLTVAHVAPSPGRAHHASGPEDASGIVLSIGGPFWRTDCLAVVVASSHGATSEESEHEWLSLVGMLTLCTSLNYARSRIELEGIVTQHITISNNNILSSLTHLSDVEEVRGMIKKE